SDVDLTKDYAAQLNVIENVIRKAPAWRELLFLGAEVARRARKPEQALSYVKRSLVGIEPKRDEEGEDEADTYFTYVKLGVEWRRIIASCALGYVDRLNSGEEWPSKIFDEALERHRVLMNIKAVEAPSPIVAIVGGAPARQPIEYQFETIGGSSLGDS